MKQEYQNMQEQLLPSKEKQEEIWAGVVRRHEEDGQQSRRKTLRRGIAGIVSVAALLCLVILSQSGLAEGMQKYNILQAFTKKSHVTNEIQENVYTDQDEHVKMQVEEMLSDGTHVFLGICYIALDQEGKEWLAKLDPASQYKTGIDDFIISGVANSEDDFEYSNSWGQNLTEQKKLATETERHFTFSFFNGGDASVFASDHYTFQYDMPNGHREFQVPRKSDLDKILYRAGKNGAAAERFELKYLHIKKLSFQLLIQTNSKYDREEWDGLDSGIIYFVMKDGSKKRAELLSIDTPKHNSELGKLVGDSGEKYLILSGGFMKQNNSEKWETLDHPDEIAAIEISGDQYDYGDGLYVLEREK